ncbi:MAG: hypothetical protein QOC86_683, partial [Gaiellales bacterium]|nr:hypothetical protein [Gaiellales bacterium]
MSPKCAYGAFDGTGLDEQLRALGVDEVVIVGQHTHICVRHSAYGALIRGYRVTVPRDGVCCFDGVDAEAAGVSRDGLWREPDERGRADGSARLRAVERPNRSGLLAGGCVDSAQSFLTW